MGLQLWSFKNVHILVLKEGAVFIKMHFREVLLSETSVVELSWPLELQSHLALNTPSRQNFDKHRMMTFEF